MGVCDVWGCKSEFKGSSSGSLVAWVALPAMDVEALMDAEPVNNWQG